MKKLKYLLIIIIYLVFIIYGTTVVLNVLNSDLYGRLIETIPCETINSVKTPSDTLPTVTLILHKYLSDESSVEASLVINFDRHAIFKTYNSRKLDFMVRLLDGYNNAPIGLLSSFSFVDSSNLNTYGFYHSGFESDRFQIPVVPSLHGFPYDNIQLLPIIYLYVNNIFSEFYFKVQKRIPGRIVTLDSKDRRIIVLSRTSTEIYLVIISSFIFLLITILLTYSLVFSKRGLSTVEELVAVAGYILATAGFKELLGITRNNGTSALEIFVILVPLLSVFSGLVFSFYKSKKSVTKK